MRPQNLEEYEVDAQTESCLSEKFFPQESPARSPEVPPTEVAEKAPDLVPDGPVTVFDGHTEGAVDDAEERQSWAEEEAERSEEDELHTQI